MRRASDALVSVLPLPGRCVWCGEPAAYPSYYCRPCIDRLAVEDRREAREELASIDEHREELERNRR